jgi:hypothetical protein
MNLKLAVSEYFFYLKEKVSLPAGRSFEELLELLLAQLPQILASFLTQNYDKTQAQLCYLFANEGVRHPPPAMPSEQTADG